MASIKEVLDKIGGKEIRLAGLNESAAAYLVSRLIREGSSRTYLFLAHTGKEAVRFQRNVEFFLGSLSQGETLFFPPYDVLPFSQLSPHNDIASQRLAALFALQRKTPPAFVTTTVAAALNFLPPKDILRKPILIRKNEDLNRDSLIETLVHWGYQNVPLVLDRGNFSIRGGIVDIFSPTYARPLRIEWIGDRIESLRAFDPASQRSLEEKEEALLIPGREVILNDATIRTFSEKTRALGSERDISKSQWGPMIEKVKDRIPFPGIETYLPLFYGETTTFWDWLPADTVVLSFCFSDISGLIEDYTSEARTLNAGKELLLSPEDVLLTTDLFRKKVFEHPTISLDRVAGASSIDFRGETHEMIRREIEASKKTGEPLSPLSTRLRRWLPTDEVFLIAASEPQAHRLKDLLSHDFPDLPILNEEFPEAKPEPGRGAILIGDLAGGFRLPLEKIAIVTEDEIFGQKVRRRTKDGAKGLTLSSFSNLKPGDPIVHKEHGIGLYQGLLHMTIDGSENDYLVIEYKEGDKLYLPVYRMNLVQRYTGAEKAPRIDKMGGASWAKIKDKSEKIIRELAGELLNLYAARTTGKGHHYSPPNELFEAFEASFPYEETPDQERAIQDVLEDMLKDQPMDRLVLGDVGYGKTEVALRAAFKAALDSKQTIFLVPTTVLAFQHYERFLERFKGYPVTIEMISRFRSASEQKKILKDAAAGKIDILIGTHRLLQPDVAFKDLSLLIIDEEHRFGVEQKEKIKRLKKNVDVLALSATPIPRSLYMSLVGIRGISIIETPPTDRLAIRTFVTHFEDEVIREALRREFKRGGQVFFVHNEVQTIGKMKEYLAGLVPEAKIEIGHGQMEEDNLEDVMIRFLHQDFNVLLCTTIIESGIDIATANTILINKADLFGLAQIYQLRGRVGRGNHRAYAYLLTEPDKALTKDATKRLAVLQRFSDLGAGYQMASYDLEIRGAGNLLGSQQSGQMAAIGYELYTELLENAVRELKGEKVLEEIDPELHFKISAYLPQDYIADPPVRLELYRRLASLWEEEDIDPITEEILDRFGEPPDAVKNLLELSVIKILAKKLRIRQIRYDGKRFLYAFDPSTPLPPEPLLALIKKDPHRHKLTPDFRFTVNKPFSKPEEAMSEAKKFLRELNLH